MWRGVRNEGVEGGERAGGEFGGGGGGGGALRRRAPPPPPSPPLLSPAVLRRRRRPRPLARKEGGWRRRPRGRRRSSSVCVCVWRALLGSNPCPSRGAAFYGFSLGGGSCVRCKDGRQGGGRSLCVSLAVPSFSPDGRRARRKRVGSGPSKRGSGAQAGTFTLPSSSFLESLQGRDHKYLQNLRADSGLSARPLLPSPPQVPCDTKSGPLWCGMRGPLSSLPPPPTLNPPPKLSRRIRIRARTNARTHRTTRHAHAPHTHRGSACACRV